MNSLFSQLDIRPSDYNIYIETENSQEGIIAHGYTGYVDVLPADTVAYIKGGMVGRTPDSGIDRNALFERGYLTRKSKAGEQDLIKKILKRAYELRTTPSYTMLLSYDCNFRCTYCNQREVQSRGNRYLSPRMTDEVMDSAFRFMEGGRSDFGLTLFGGEPLSRGNQHQVKRYLKWVKRMGKTTGIISNGFDWEYFRDVMDPEVINGIQVTIDGPKSCHDSRRILVGRQGTFDKILANVKIGLERGLNIYCRINIDSGNAPEIHNLIHHFEKLGLTDFPGFSYYAAHIAANGINDGKKQLFGPESMHKSLGCGSGACSSSSSTSCAPEATGQEKAAQQMLPQALVGGIARAMINGGRAPMNPTYCGAYTTMNCIDPYGDLYACWEVVGHKEHIIGQYHPEIKLNSEMEAAWRGRPTLAVIPNCMECPYILYHGGGCQVRAHQATGDFNEKMCEDYPWVFDESARRALEAKNLGETNRIMGRRPLVPDSPVVEPIINTEMLLEKSS